MNKCFPPQICALLISFMTHFSCNLLEWMYFGISIIPTLYTWTLCVFIHALSVSTYTVASPLKYIRVMCRFLPLFLPPNTCKAKNTSKESRNSHNLSVLVIIVVSPPRYIRVMHRFSPLVLPPGTYTLETLY